MTKHEVIDLIEKEYARIYTCPDNPCDKDKGAKVRVFPYNGKKYLRSVEDDVSRDNLGSLPNFCKK